MDRSRRRTTLYGVYKHDDLSFIKNIKWARVSTGQLHEFAFEVTAFPQAVNNFQTYVVVGGKGIAAPND
jgi:hypothetical protein